MYFGVFVLGRRVDIRGKGGVSSRGDLVAPVECFSSCFYLIAFFVLCCRSVLQDYHFRNIVSFFFFFSCFSNEEKEIKGGGVILKFKKQKLFVHILFIFFDTVYFFTI